MTKMSKVIGIALAVTAIFFGSCSNDGSDNEATDKDGFKYEGIAYPGANCIKWNGSVGSITCYRDDGVTISSDGKSFWDTKVEDGEEYTYTLKDVKTASGSLATITLKAIKPAFMKDSTTRLTALDLTDYENGEYDANASKDGVVTKENLDFQIDKKDNFVVVSFPQKEYLDYEVTLYKGNSAELLPAALSKTNNAANDNADKGKIDDVYKAALVKTNKTGVYASEGMITKPGNYQVVVKVDAKKNKKSTDPTYYASSYVYSKMVSVDRVDVATPTSGVKAAFTDYTNAKVRVEWYPAIKPDGKTLYAVDKYHVYAYDKDTLEVKEVPSNTIKSAKKQEETVYYVDTTVKVDSGKNSKKVVYRVILSDNERYEDKDNDGIDDVDGTNSNELVWYQTSEAEAGRDIVVSSSWDDNTAKLYINGASLPSGVTVSVRYTTFKKNSEYYQNVAGTNNYAELFLTDQHISTASFVPYKVGDSTLYYEATLATVNRSTTGVAWEVTFKESGKKDRGIGDILVN